MLESSIFSRNTNEIELYHGSTVEVRQPLFGYGRFDNDYGQGFYTTAIYDKAISWAKTMGNECNAVVNTYTIDLSKLRVLNLNEYGPLAWIAEIAANRPINSELAKDFLPDFVSIYKVDTSAADVIIGYRADDSYTDVVGAFCDGLLNCDEVKRLFYKGSLGEQYFIKSAKAFDLLHFESSQNVTMLEIESESEEEMLARNEVYKFINQRRLAIIKRYQVPPITIIDAIANRYVYNKELEYYEMV